MNEKPIKVDEQTDRLVTDLAHFLRRTKKSVVRDAVAEFVEAHHTALRAITGTSSLGSDAIPTVDSLPIRDRLALRRGELLREFAREGATEVRVADPSDDDVGPHMLSLIARTEVEQGSDAAPRLESIARRVLGAPVEVISLTALELFSPGRVPAVLAVSRPL